MDWKLVGGFMICKVTGVQIIDDTVTDIQLFDSGPSAIGDKLC